MKRSSKKSSFISPVKNIDNNSDNNNNNNNNNNTNNNIFVNKTLKKKSSSFQTPIKIIASTPNNNNNTTSTTTSTTSTKNNNTTPQGLILTNVKSINSEIFTEIPKYILEFLNQFNQDSEKEQYKLIIEYSYLNWSNNPFNEYDLFDIYKDKFLNLEKVKEIIINLVCNNILKEISIKDNIKIYSSIPWFKLINYVGLEIEFKRYEERQLELEKEKEKEEMNKKKSKYNTASAPKTTLATIVATLSPSKPKENHLSSSSSNKKRKSTTTPIPFNLNQALDNNESTAKKLKTKTNNIKSSKYELSIDRELILISDEKKRLLKSIQDKKDALLKFQSTSNSPISEQKKVVPNQQEEKRVEGLIYKWKKASQDAITLLQEKVIGIMGKHQQQQIPNNIYRYDSREINNYKSSSEWNTDQDTDENDRQYQEEFKYDYFEKEITTKEQNQPEITSKLYIINQFGLNAKDLNYDQENDQFKKL